MNDQLLLECFAEETEISWEEAVLLDIELFAQIERIKVSSKQGCLSVDPNHI